MTAWYEKFFDGLYTRVLPNTFDGALSQKQARAIKRLLQVRKGQCVLDIPCGTGRLTLPLARMGLRVTGVDLTAQYLRRARAEAKREYIDARFVHGDMRHIDYDGAFDGAFNWFGSFGYFSDADNLSFCRRVFRALKPGGRFLVEGGNKSWILAHFRPRSEQTIGGVRITQRHCWDETRNRIFSTWTFRRGKATERHTVRMRLFNGTEMRALLREAGFRDIALFPWPPDRPFSRHSRRLVAVGTRPRAQDVG